MAIRRSNSINLPGVLGGAIAPLKKAFAIAAGYTLYPGMAAYFADGTGETVRPPLADGALIQFSVAPSSGDTLTVIVNGVTKTQAWDTDATTTMAALATQLATVTDVATATVQDSNKDILLAADPGKECIVTSVSNSDGTTTDTCTHTTTDTFAGIVTRERSEGSGSDNILKFTAPKMVTLLVDGDSISAGIGGEDSDTFDINSDVYVRIVEGDTDAHEYKGQICASAGPAALTYAVAVSSLSFEGDGDQGDYEFIQVTKGA